MVLTVVATIYLGWHYVVDDIAGIAIGGASLLLAKWLTGFDPRTAAGGSAVAAARTGPRREPVPADAR
jgi:membrane-associated phospholipid phosphatase